MSQIRYQEEDFKRYLWSNGS